MDRSPASCVKLLHLEYGCESPLTIVVAVVEAYLILTPMFEPDLKLIEADLKLLMLRFLRLELR